MPEVSYEVVFKKSDNYVVTRFSGLLSYQAILECFDKVVHSTHYHPGMGRLWDLSETDLSLLTEETVWLACTYATVFPIGISDVKVAMVSSNEAHEALLHLFKSFSTETHTTVAIFQDLQEAESWIADPPDK